MSEWVAHKQDFVLINNLGFAFLRRVSGDEAIFATMGKVDPARQADSIRAIWNLLRESPKCVVCMHCKLRAITLSRRCWQMFLSSFIPSSAQARPSVSKDKFGKPSAE
jgi:uncharacterized membrane protein